MPNFLFFLNSYNNRFKNFDVAVFIGVLIQIIIIVYSTILAFKISRYLLDAIIFIFIGFTVADLLVLSIDSEKFYTDVNLKDKKHSRQFGYLFLGFAYLCIIISILSLITKLNPPEYATFSILVSMTGVFFSLAAYRMYNRLDEIIKFGSETFWTVIIFIIILAGAYKIIVSGEYVRASFIDEVWIVMPLAIIFYAWLFFILYHFGFLKRRGDRQ